jgi:hypothetical protein
LRIALRAEGSALPHGIVQHRSQLGDNLQNRRSQGYQEDGRKDQKEQWEDHLHGDFARRFVGFLPRPDPQVMDVRAQRWRQAGSEAVGVDRSTMALQPRRRSNSYQSQINFPLCSFEERPKIRAPKLNVSCLRSESIAFGLSDAAAKMERHLGRDSMGTISGTVPKSEKEQRAEIVYKSLN